MAENRMDRRLFVKLFGTTAVAGTLGLYPITVSAQETHQKRKERFKLSRPEWIIYENGSYDLISKEIILKNCRPAIDGQGVMPKNVFLGDSPKGKRIVYELSGGFLMLDLKTHRDSVSIGTELSGFSRSPRWFYPISQAQIHGAGYFFRQSFGTGGCSEVIKIESAAEKATNILSREESWSFDSFMSFALFGNQETIAIGNVDYNDFFHRSTIYNKPHRTGFRFAVPGEEQIFFESAMLLEKTPVENEYIKLPDLYFYAGNKSFETMRELAWKQSKVSESRQGNTTSFHWIVKPDGKEEYAFDYLKSQVGYVVDLKPELPLHTIVVGQGYCTIGDWLKPNDKWPGKPDRAAREIFKNGFRAGIWIAPFIVAEESEVFRQHPEWIAKDYNHQPIIEETDEEGVCYALDISHPEVLKHLQKIFKSLRKSGFIFFETAYLNAGFKDSLKVKKTTPDESSVQTFRKALQVIREEIGSGSLIMANQTPFAPVTGFADMVKTGSDNINDWESSRVGVMIQESYLTQYFNNILWQNEPADISLLDNSSGFTENERISLSLWCGILGGAVGTSVSVSRLDAHQIKLLRFLEPNKRYQNAEFPYWPSTSEIKVAVREYRSHRSWGVLFFNDKDEPFSKKYPVNDLINQNSVYVFAWKPQPPVAFGVMSEILVSLKPHESRLFYFSREFLPPPENLTLGGNVSAGL